MSQFVKYKCMNKEGYKLATDGDGVITSRPHQVRSTVISQISFCIRAGNAGDSGVLLMNGNNVRVRKLTPTECYKLMGFDAEDCKKASDGGISNSQLYKQAGNSIVVNVLEAIFTSLGDKYEEFRSVS